MPDMNATEDSPLAEPPIDGASRGNQAGRPTLEELGRRKQRIIEAATELFIAEGYAGASFVEIAKRAGVATRTVYQHFGDKQDLFRYVIFARDVNADIERPFVRSGDVLLDALFRAARYVCESGLRERSVGLMRLIIAEGQRFPAWTKKATDAALNRLVGDVAAVFSKLAEAGLIPPTDPEDTARIFIDFILGLAPLRFYANWERSFPSDQHIRRKVEIFILGNFGPEIAGQSATKRVRSTPPSTRAAS
jgi:TetR/AcrR family transcriptional regulator, mexJK operon transcriptional repressor